MAKLQKKSVKKTVKHDSLTVAATYPTGGKFRFSVGRSGERLTLAGAAGAEAKRQLAALAKFVRFLPGETNGQRIERIYAVAADAESIAELVDLAKCSQPLGR
jgi:hypothetical protein